MNKSLIAVAAAAFAVTFAPAAEAGFNLRVGGATSLVQKAEWDAEDAADYVEERAEERAEAREEAYEDSDALEDGEGAYPRQRSARRQSQARAKVSDTAQASEKPAQASTETSTTADVSDKPETKKSEAKKTEAKSAVAAADGSRSCKQFFPSVGMTLSVPCE